MSDPTGNALAAHRDGDRLSPTVIAGIRSVIEQCSTPGSIGREALTTLLTAYEQLREECDEVQDNWEEYMLVVTKSFGERQLAEMEACIAKLRAEL